MTTPVAGQPEPLLVTTGGERAVLAAFLDFHRGVVCRKAGGLSEQDARRALVPSGTTLAGIVRHLTVVEHHWFAEVMSGQDRLGADSGWAVPETDKLADLIAEYRAGCERSRRLVADLPLEFTAPHPGLGRVNLRWVYVHMIEETARHAGHADILREQLDGSIGVLG